MNGGISGGPYTLTVNGSGEVIINGKGGTDGCDGIQGNVIMNGGTLTATGGGGGSQVGGIGIYGDVTLNGGTLKSTGGTGGYNSGSAFFDDVIINEGKAFFTDDGTQSFRGPLELNADQKAAIAGKFLTPYPVAIGENAYPTIQDAKTAFIFRT